MPQLKEVFTEEELEYFKGLSDAGSITRALTDEQLAKFDKVTNQPNSKVWIAYLLEHLLHKYSANMVGDCQLECQDKSV